MGFKDTFFSENLSINCRGRLLDLSRPAVMGILNVTPDSFFDGGKYTDSIAIKKRVRQIMDEGADIIDIGGYSSRPGSVAVSEGEEWNRIRPALEIIRTMDMDIPISVDTFRSVIASRAVSEFQADIINDITGGSGDPEMFDFIAGSGTPYILMHMQGTPETMQKEPSYDDVVDEVLDFLQERSSELRKRGALDIIIDPGFGFGKTVTHNYQLLSALEVFTALEMPVLAGISRKSMVYHFLEVRPEDSLNGTAALHMYALVKGARILRVHDVKEAVEVKKLFEKLYLEEGKV
ncbi:MAG: dihydropteroate synthase [Bacteroidales bacterium]|nr:dihydropteroate synthase [Bacteroidales bacterium]